MRRKPKSPFGRAKLARPIWNEAYIYLCLVLKLPWSNRSLYLDYCEFRVHHPYHPGERRVRLSHYSFSSGGAYWINWELKPRKR